MLFEWLSNLSNTPSARTTTCNSFSFSGPLRQLGLPTRGLLIAIYHLASEPSRVIPIMSLKCLKTSIKCFRKEEWFWCFRNSSNACWLLIRSESFTKRQTRGVSFHFDINGKRITSLTQIGSQNSLDTVMKHYLIVLAYKDATKN